MKYLRRSHKKASKPETAVPTMLPSAADGNATPNVSPLTPALSQARDSSTTDSTTGNIDDKVRKRKRLLNAAKEILKKALEVLGKAPSITGIGAATTAAIAIIQTFEDNAQASEEWHDLAEKVARVSVLLDQARKLPSEGLNIYFEDTEKLLTELQKAIEDGASQNGAQAFLIFLSADRLKGAKTWENKLDRCITYLTTAIVVSTGLKITEVNQDIDKAIEDLHRAATSTNSNIEMIAKLEGITAELDVQVQRNIAVRDGALNLKLEAKNVKAKSLIAQSDISVGQKYGLQQYLSKVESSVQT